MADDETLEDAPDSETGAGETTLSKSQPWLSMLDASDKAFKDYQDKCDNIDKLYANMSRLASSSREREFQLFWANIQVLGPSIYSRPPVPVVVPRFKDRRPIARTSAEVLERVSIVTMETQDLDSALISVRNDLTVISRGQVWVQLETKDGEDYVTVSHLDRRDYRCDPTQSEHDCDWKAKRAWMTKKEARARFYKTSGRLYQDATYIGAKKRNDSYADGGDDKSMKAPIWEIWCKSANKVIWVAEGCDTVLDEGEPHLQLEGFFPCPKPAVGTLQRGTIVPIPDILFYKDQLEEINEITGRIAALTDAVKVRGFYPAGAASITDAIENAVNATTNNAMLIPISNWAAMGGGNAKDMVLWWPLDQIAIVIKELIELRKQLIDDVYQITGLSDIMRGSSVASETLGAQKLKSQYGSVRIRDRQNEMTRLARDTIRIVCEIIAENYTSKQINELAQMQLPTDADIKAKMKPLEDDLKQIALMTQKAQSDPAIMAKAQQSPELAQKAIQEAQQQSQAIQKQLQELTSTVTIDQVMKFLRDNRMRGFSLDIETDSTIQPDEDAAKQRATEYITAMSSLFQQAIPAVTQVPQMAPLLSEIINFANSQFRVGRTMSTVVEEFTDQMKQMAAQPKPDPNAAQQQSDQAKMQHDQQMAQAKLQTDAQAAQAKAQSDAEANARKAQWDQQQAQNKHEETLLNTQFEMKKLDVETQLNSEKIAAELKKQEMANLTSIEVARINHDSAMAKLELESKLEADLGIAQHAQAMELANTNNQASMNQTKMTTAAKATPDGVTQNAPEFDEQGNELPPKPSAVELIQQQMQDHHQQQLASHAALVNAVSGLHKTMAAPQQVTTPDGRTFTSQRIMQ